MLLVWNKIFKLRIVQILQFSLYLNQQYTYIHMQTADIIISAKIQSNATKFQSR